MKVKDLRRLIKGCPADMPVLLVNHMIDYQTPRNVIGEIQQVWATSREGLGRVAWSLKPERPNEKARKVAAIVLR